MGKSKSSLRSKTEKRKTEYNKTMQACNAISELLREAKEHDEEDSDKSKYGVNNKEEEEEERKAGKKGEKEKQLV
ncbi:hypothetical protein L3X38_029749 [Prunus dulcis]|uniref:Uncharacterized protein n=1 Tax=Prunus dulcis TaxID=3755 RepID=A0AAD4Z2J0_PRUDU|nr:hypothetical protein L3X38_029749 [Prunus dulcis]